MFTNHNGITRQTNIGAMYVFNATTAYMQKSPLYSGSLLLNRLPHTYTYQKCHQLKHIQTLMQILALNIFKRLCKYWLLSQRDSN